MAACGEELAWNIKHLTKIVNFCKVLLNVQHRQQLTHHSFIIVQASYEDSPVY